MRFVLLGLSVAYAMVNVFGAWATVRRHRWVATAFMVAAGLLVTAGIAYAYGASEGFVLLVVGAVGASLASFASARWVSGRLLPVPHLLRAGAAVLLIGLGWWFLPV